MGIKIYCKTCTKIDKFLKGDGFPNNFYKTYLESYSFDSLTKTYDIRLPGRTVGSVTVDKSNIVLDIVLHEYSKDNFYENVFEEIKSYIGLKL